MFTGCFSALVSPFNESNQLDVVSLKQIVRFHKANDCLKVVVLGTTGERMSLSDDEQQMVIKMAVDEGLTVVVGSGCNCTERSVKHANMARSLGAVGVLAIVPYYNRPPFRGIVEHFKAIADVGLPVIVYHHPKRTGTTLNVEELVELSQIDGIIAIKEASSDLGFAKELIEAIDVPVLCGDDGLTLEMLKLGAKGTVSVVSNAIPADWCRMVELGLKGNWREAEEIEKQFRPLVEALGLETNPITVKYALSVMGLCKPCLRLPLCEPLEKTKLAIKKALAARALSQVLFVDEGA